MADSRMIDEIYKTSLDPIIMTESKEVLKNKQKKLHNDGGYVRDFQKPIESAPNGKDAVTLSNKIKKYWLYPKYKISINEPMVI